jgi:hypothetical protein
MGVEKLSVEKDFFQDHTPIYGLIFIRLPKYGLSLNMPVFVDKAVDMFSRNSPQGDLVPLVDAGTRSRHDAMFIIHI